MEQEILDNLITYGRANATDNDTISPVIQSTNQSHVPSSRPRADVCSKGKDTRSNPEHYVERKS